MSTALIPSYYPPSRGTLSNILIPAWYEVEKKNLISELASASKVAITADGWTSITQDHYITVALNYVNEGQLRQKVLKTQAVCESQNGPVVAEEIREILAEFRVREMVVAITVANAANMEVAVQSHGFSWLKDLWSGILPSKQPSWTHKSKGSKMGF